MRDANLETASTVAQALIVEPDEARQLDERGVKAFEAFQRSDTEDDLLAAITAFQQSTHLTPKGHEQEPIRLSHLGSALLAHFQREPTTSDVDEAIHAFQQAQDSASHGGPPDAQYAVDLGTALRYRFQHFPSPENINQAVELHRRALILPDADLRKPGFLHELGMSLLARHTALFDRADDELRADINEAVDVMKSAVGLTLHDDPEKADRLQTLGVAHARMADAYGNNDDDIIGAFEAYEEALALIPRDDPRRAVCLNRLGSAATQRFQRYGAREHIDLAIASFNDALKLSPSPSFQSVVKTNLSGALHGQFAAFGEREDLDNAIQAQTEALALLPSGDPDEANWLNNIGMLLRERSNLFNLPGDLEQAVAKQQQAVDMTLDRDPLKPKLLNDLGCTHIAKFERDPESQDGLAALASAIVNIQRALEIANPAHPFLAMCHTNLGVALAYRFDSSGSDSDLDAAIQAHEKAKDLTPADDPERPMRVANYTSTLHRRFMAREDRADIDTAIDALQVALTALPEGHPNEPGFHMNLGVMFKSRFEVREGGLGDDIVSAIKSYKAAADCKVGSPQWRFDTALKVVRLARQYSMPMFVLAGYKRAFELLPELVWAGLPTETRHETLKDVGHLASSTLR